MNYRVMIKEMPTRLDSLTAQPLSNEIMNHYSGQHGMLLLDFKHCKFIDSCGLALIIQSVKESRRTCQGLRLVRMNPQAKKLLSVSKLERFLPVYDSEEAALRA